MNPTLGLCSLVLLLAATATELWWGSAARSRRRAGLAHLQQHLGRGDSLGAAGGVPDYADGSEPPWRGVLQRAGFVTGERLPWLLVAAGVLFALASAWRLGTAWAALPLFALYALLASLWLLLRTGRHRQRMTRQLPDFLDAMVRVVALGNSLPVAFHTATQATPPPLRGLLDRTLQRMHAGLDLDEALRQSGRLYRLESVELLEAVIAMSMRFGGRTDQVLQRMSGFMRDLEQAQLELKAITAETRMSSWVLGLLPLLCGAFMMLVDPAFFRPMFEQPLGHRLLALAAILELVGACLLYRLAKSL
jgi:tight adherence protein B